MSEKMSPVEYGDYLYLHRGCANCHSLDGGAGTGPSFKGIYGKPVELEGARPSRSRTTTSAIRSSSRGRKSSRDIGT